MQPLLTSQTKVLGGGCFAGGNGRSSIAYSCNEGTRLHGDAHVDIWHDDRMWGPEEADIYA